MSDKPVLRSPQVVANELDISPATLRRWSDEFTDHLSIGAGANKSGSHRRYTNDDLSLLRVVKELMSGGHTYEQVRQKLNGHDTDNYESPDPVPEPEENLSIIESKAENDLNDDDMDDDDPEEIEERAMVTSGDEEPPAIAFLTNTLTTLSDSQKSLLNSQAANRELMGVLLQDNFNLKEENNRLRERILEVERDVSQNRQEEEWRREAMRQELEAKVSMAQQMAQKAIATAQSIEVEVPEIKTTKSNPGCLGAMLGLTNTEVAVVPRRRKGKSAQAAGPVGGAPQYPASPSTASRPVHPRPTAPPE